MENSSKPQQHRENPSSLDSANSNGTTGSTSNTNNGGSAPAHFLQTPPLTPKPISRSETNPYPTTFVQADTSTFKHVVQMLTGSSETAKQASRPPPQDPPSKCAIPPVKTASRKQSFKLYERRGQAQHLKNSLIINTLIPGFSAANSPRHQQEILSPSILDFPKLSLSSPVTPLNDDPFTRTSGSSSSEEDRAIAEKGFYLHPSPMSTPRDGAEPQLLPLFPVTSPLPNSRNESK